MNTELLNFAARLREHISCPSANFSEAQFSELALELFALQFKYNPACQKICTARRLTPAVMEHWRQIPAVPTSAFKELELSSIPVEEREAVFHSSGTTEQIPSRHFHHKESLAVYEASLWHGFLRQFSLTGQWLFLTPSPALAPHSSLIHMFETVRQKLDLPTTAFAGSIASDGSWVLDFPAIIRQLQTAVASALPITLLGTAFSFVHLLDHLSEMDLHFQLPAGSRVMETGGYKNRSRTMPKAQLHDLITARLGVSGEQIVCEYGMSELSSQAYSVMSDKWPVTSQEPTTHHSSPVTRHFTPHFQFPPWARVQIISPETGREVAEGQTGIIRVLDLANVYSVAAMQTEDLGIRRGDGFELIGRAEKAEPRGCSLMTLSQ